MKMTIIRRHRTPLLRQIAESVAIKWSKVAILMNSKGDHNGSRIPRVVIEVGDKAHYDDNLGIREEKAAMTTKAAKREREEELCLISPAAKQGRTAQACGKPPRVLQGKMTSWLVERVVEKVDKVGLGVGVVSELYVGNGRSDPDVGLKDDDEEGGDDGEEEPGPGETTTIPHLHPEEKEEENERKEDDPQKDRDGRERPGAAGGAHRHQMEDTQHEEELLEKNRRKPQGISSRGRMVLPQAKPKLKPKFKPGLGITCSKKWPGLLDKQTAEGLTDWIGGKDQRFPGGARTGGEPVVRGQPAT